MPENVSKSLIRTSATVFLLFAFSHNSVAGEVDLYRSGCPEFPLPGKYLGVHLVLNENGNATDCVISNDVQQYCGRVHSGREGFLCIGFSQENRPDSTVSETIYSKKNDRLVVDGEVVGEVYGESKHLLKRDFGTGPSGEIYDVSADLTVGSTVFTMTVNVTAKPDGVVQLNSMKVTYPD